MSLRPIARSTWRLRVPRRHYATSYKPPPFPTTPTCPNPTCTCSAMPELPPSLPIDYKTALNGTMAPYAEQVLICTGQEDWSSRIEDENSGDNMAAVLKKLVGRGSMYYTDVCPAIFQGRRGLLTVSSLCLTYPSQIPHFPQRYPRGRRFRIHPHTSSHHSNTSPSYLETPWVPFTS